MYRLNLDACNETGATMMTDQIYIRDDLCVQSNSAIVSTVQEIYLK